MKSEPKAIPRSALTKLGKMIPRLSSSNDGEVIATVRAIERVLVAAGASFHELAALVNGDGAATAYSLNLIDLCKECLGSEALRPNEIRFLIQIVESLTVNPEFRL